MTRMLALRAANVGRPPIIVASIPGTFGMPPLR